MKPRRGSDRDESDDERDVVVKARETARKWANGGKRDRG